MTTASYFRQQAGTLLCLAQECRQQETAERLRAMAADLKVRADELESEAPAFTGRPSRDRNRKSN